MAAFHGTEALRLGKISWLSTFLFLYPVYLMGHQILLPLSSRGLCISIFLCYFCLFSFIQALKHSSLVCTNSLLICLSLVCAFLEDMLYSATETKFLRILVHHAISLNIIRHASWYLLCASHCSGCCVLVGKQVRQGPCPLGHSALSIDSKQGNEMLTLW